MGLLNLGDSGGFRDVLKFGGEMFGFETGNVRLPYDGPDIYDPVGTKMAVQKLLALYNEVISAVRSGDTNKFMSEEFQARLNDALVPLKAANTSARERVLQNASRMGLDPMATARLTEQIDRAYGSEAAATGRNITGQRGNMILNLLSSIPGFLTNQQNMYAAEKHFENNWDNQRQMERDDRRAANAAATRNLIVGMGGGGAFGMGGGGFGMDFLGGMGGGSKQPGGSYGYDPVSDAYQLRPSGQET